MSYTVSQYGRFYGEEFVNKNNKHLFTAGPEFIIEYLRSRQGLCNAMLRADGFLFLYQVYDMLGLELTEASLSVGWIYDENSPGDSFVDFGINERHNLDFINGFSDRLCLDFNVDGEIRSRI